MSFTNHKLIFASNKNRVPTIDHYESIILANDSWNYIVPTSEPASDWKIPGTILSGWSSGIGGIGFGDADDGTVITTATSVFLRKSFTLSAINIAEIEKLILLNPNIINENGEWIKKGNAIDIFEKICFIPR